MPQLPAWRRSGGDPLELQASDQLDLTQHNEVWASASRLPSGRRIRSLLAGPRTNVVRYTEVVDFELASNTIRIRTHDPAYAFMTDVHLLGTVMAHHQELRGNIAMHASCAHRDGVTIAICGATGAGKTSTLLRLLEDGWDFMADDLLPVTPQGVAWPAYPSIRLWPDDIERRLGEDPEAHPRFTPATNKRRVPVLGRWGSHAEPAPLAAVAILEPGASWHQLSGAAAVHALATHGFLTDREPSLIPAAERLRRTVELAGAVPVVATDREQLPRELERSLGSAHRTR